MLSENIKTAISQAEMLNFGSGPSAYAFDYEAAGINGVNLAMTPSAFGMETAFLKEYAEIFPKGCAAVFAVCPFSFGDNRTKSNPARYARYYSVLSRKAIDALEAPLAHWNEEIAASADEKNPLFPYGAEINRDEVPSEEVMANRITQMCNCWKGEFGLSDFIDKTQAEAQGTAFQRERGALDRLLFTARKIGLRPFLLLPPLHPRLRELISHAFFDAFVLCRLKDCDCPLIDLTAHPLIAENMFLGPVFLNRKGAETVTKYVYEQTKCL